MNKKKFILFILIFILSFCYSYFISSIYFDEIWNYGFSYNIYNGLVPYRDFNMIITPLFHFVTSFFIFIFGNHLWAMHIFNSILTSIIFIISYNTLGKKVYIFYPFLLLYCYPGYNFFCLFLIILILYLSDKELKNWDLILGLLVSLLFLTKQTIGLCMFIPMIYYSKNKLKSLICFLIPVFLFVIYLLWNNALCNFIDYCFLGMFDFTGSNSIYLFFPFEIVICFVLIFKLIKCRFNDKKLFYVIMFQIISIPICDDYHFMIAFLAVLYYLLDNLKIKLYKVKYLIIIFIVIMFGKIYLFNYGIEYSLYSDKDSYLYGRYIERYIEEDLTNISYYLNDIKDSYDYVFLLTVNSYMIKLNTDYDINKFDLINNGNMGYNGYAKYINEIDNICSSNSCVFVLCKIEVDDDSNFQTNKEILNYVIDNYYFVEELYGFDVYSNSEVYYE